MEAVRELRRRKGWSQQNLADASGVGQDTISSLELGRHQPRPSTLRKIAGALGVEVANLFGESVPSPKGREFFDIDRLKEEAIEKARPRNSSEIQRSVEEELERRYSPEELFALKEEQLELVEELAPEKEARFEEYAKAVESANYVRRVLEKVAGRVK